MTTNINSEQIKILRHKTGAGIMDCKKALLENNGDIDIAVDWLRKKGIASAEKKATRVASEGLVGIVNRGNLSCLIEVNSETDFVSKNTDFQNFVNQLLHIAIKSKTTLKDFSHLPFNDTQTVEDSLKNIVAKIGENIVIRRLEYLECHEKNFSYGFYIHNKVSDNLGKIGCIVLASTTLTNKENDEFSKKIAMHVAAAKPLAIDESNLDKSLISKEREIFKEQLSSTNKPQQILDKIIDGKVKKYLSEVTLLNQAWIMEPSINIKKVIDDYNKTNNENFNVMDFSLFVLGEGVEVSEKNFKDEVAAQIKQ